MGKIRIAAEFDRMADLILYEGDCLDLLPLIPDNFVKLVVTSPPYNLGKPYETRLDMDEYLAQQRMVIEECVRVLNDRGSICWQVGNYVDNSEIIPLDIVLYPIFASLGLHLRNRIVWHFGHGLPKATNTPLIWMLSVCPKNIRRKSTSRGRKRDNFRATLWARIPATFGKSPT